MRQRFLLLFVTLLFATTLISVRAGAQIYEWNLKPIFDQPIESGDVWSFEQLQYALDKQPALPSPSSSAEWTREAESLRRQYLEKIIYRGWPRDVIEAKPVFEDVGTIPSGKGYRIQKLRYEIIPGMWSTALLYEPENLTGKVPAVMSVLGHYYGKGKAMDFNQVLCINYALRGMIAITPEWLDMGELNNPESDHSNFEAQIDFVGTSSVGLFYLAMRRVLDYLSMNPNVDKSRIGMTGLSGGGWQTITLSALDPRIRASIPVAGFESVLSKMDKLSIPLSPGGGDPEEDPTDAHTILDYATLAAMRAPRPTLEIYNAEDDCCFRALVTKPYVFDAVKPFFALYGKEDLLQYYENRDPGTHNYELDTREQSYRFFDKQLSLPADDREIPVQAELKSYEELEVGVPKDNLTFLGLARSLASKISRPPIPQDSAARAAWVASEKPKLESVVRYKPVIVKHPWAVASTKNKGVESISYRFQLSNNLSATGILLREIWTPADAPVTIFLDDKGKEAAITEATHQVPIISDLLERRNQVLVLDLLYTPSAGSKTRPQAAWVYGELLAGFGERPLGIEAAQLVGIAEWVRKSSRSKRLDVVSYGIRDQVIALVASALRPELFTHVDIRQGMKSLNYLLEKPVTYPEASDLFCQDFYKEFDLDQLATLAEPTSISTEILTVEKK